MSHSIFAKSTLRQPIRTALLLLITALMVFAFTARATEYLLVKQETERLGSYYRAIGQLSYVDQDHGTSADEAISLLENDPRVAFVDQPRYLSAVMQDIYNADISGSKRLAVNQRNLDFFFTGIFRGTAETLSGDVLCTFVPEALLSGYPEFIEVGRAVSMFVSQDEVIDTVKALKIGERYLVRGRFDKSKDMTFSVTHVPTKFCALPLAENVPLFYHIAAGEELDWSAPALSGAAAEMQQCRDEQSALMAVTTKDMSAMPIVQPDTLLYLTDGRWLDSTDQAAQNKVCVINDAFAQLRGLRVGDTITLTFRNVLTSYGYIDYPANGDIPYYETASDTFEIVGLYDYIIADMRSWDVAFYRNYAYFVDSAVPAAFDVFEDVRTVSDLSFVLTSPALEAEFLVQTQERLSALGLRAEFLENGWADFQAAVQPMRHASLYNLTVFTLILLTALCVVAFFYFRARRREIAIARALGVPAGVCIRQGALPLLLIGFAGAACGTVSGWQYTLNHGAETLASLSAYGGDTAEISLPGSWLAAIFGGIILLMFFLALGGMAYLSHRPTLELLQGGAQTKQMEREAAQAAPDMEQKQETAGAQVSAAALAQPLPAVTTAKRSFGIAHTLRFVGCYILRSKAKSLLVFLLAALFTVGLAAIRVSILNSTAKVDELYKTVNVNLELVKRDSSIYVNGGFISQSTIDRIVDTGFISNFYGEAECGVLDIKREDARNAVGGAPAVSPDTSSQEQQRALYSLRSFTDLDAFLSGSGSGVDILYHTGWDESMFSQDWEGYDKVHGGQSVLPVLLPQEIYEEYQITPGERIIMKIERGNGLDLRLLEVAGMYTEKVSGGSTPAILTPAGVMDVIMKGFPYYSTARFSIDPAKNRELNTFRAALDEITNAGRAGLVPLRTLLWDEDLRNAIEPLENSIRLMEVLYPVALALSLLAAAGVSALLILTEAREAAIMRVLGTTKLRSRIMLVLQIVFVVLAGLLIGLTAALAWSSSAGLALAIFGMSALCAAAYLICAVLGSTAGAVTVTNRPPLELLQVKE